jgi:signal transduction histidine kinase
MGISRTWVERASIAFAAVGVAVGVLTPVLARQDTGVRLTFGDAPGRIVVESVQPFSPAARYGVQPGMTVILVNDQAVLRLPEAIQPDPAPDATADPVTGEVPMPSPIIEPATATPVVTDQGVLTAIIQQPVRSLSVISTADLAAYDPLVGYQLIAFGDDGRDSLRDSILFVIFGLGVLFAVAWWFLTGRAGQATADLGLPLALGVAAPFLLAPLGLLWEPAVVVVHAILVPAMLLPLGVTLLGRIEGEQDRRITAVAIAACAAGSVAVGVAPLFDLGLYEMGRTSDLLAAAVTAIPGVLAAGPLLPRASVAPGGEGTVSGRLLRSTELAVIGVTPGVALLGALPGAAWLLLAWGGVIVVAGRFTVRPLARLASRAQLQRDLVIAATEAERARVAADIHDDALQELTLLVRRLDAAGDTEGADIARTVSDKLRAICGDLRLPILDDLGVGPALDWLVLRMERLAGGEVRLERTDGTRPPADVELAFFRIAQEALANAVKHGRPPIVVRYRSTDGAASLSVDDSGSGIAPDAPARAEALGRYGLLNMQQRAEGIGAILDVRRWPQGGTHVQLEWRAR